jgi:AcrR family transcriptional regulator
MQDIAQAAGLSVGQIYRYFASKEAIIAAIVAQDLAEMREKFAEYESEPGPIDDSLVRHCGDGMDKCFDRSRAALVLEVLAEAARNPRVACIVRDADTQERALCRRLIERARKPQWSDSDVEARSEILSAVFDGLVMRGVNNPDADREAMKPVLQKVIRSLFED